VTTASVDAVVVHRKRSVYAVRPEPACFARPPHPAVRRAVRVAVAHPVSHCSMPARVPVPADSALVVRSPPITRDLGGVAVLEHRGDVCRPVHGPATGQFPGRRGAPNARTRRRCPRSAVWHEAFRSPCPRRCAQGSASSRPDARPAPSAGTSTTLGAPTVSLTDFGSSDTPSICR